MPPASLPQKLGTEHIVITAVIHSQRPRWYGLVQCATPCIKSVTHLAIHWIGRRGRPRKTWSKYVRTYISNCGHFGTDPQDRDASRWGPPSQYPERRLFVRSPKVSKPRDWYFKLSYRFEIWQAPRQHCCRSACQISERSDNSKYDWIMRRGPGVRCSLMLPPHRIGHGKHPNLKWVLMDGWRSKFLPSQVICACPHLWRIFIKILVIIMKAWAVWVTGSSLYCHRAFYCPMSTYWTLSSLLYKPHLSRQ